MKHTPGPWKAQVHMIGDDPQWFIQFDGPVINNATIAAMNTSCLTYDNAENDARLIAAAPELLEALKTMLHDIGQHIPLAIRPMEPKETAAGLRASCLFAMEAIAKAEQTFAESLTGKVQP